MTMDELNALYNKMSVYGDTYGDTVAPDVPDVIEPIPDLIDPFVLPTSQGGGGGGDGGWTANDYNINQNLGPTNITDYEAEAYGIGPTWKGTWAGLLDTFSKIPTPFNLGKRGYDFVKEKKAKARIQKEKDLMAEIQADNLKAAMQAQQAQAVSAADLANIQQIQQHTGQGLSQYRMDRPASERQFTGHGTSGMGRDKSELMAYGGRIRYGEGGIASMLGERTNFRRGGPPGGGDPEMKGTGQSYGDSYGPGRDYETPSDRQPGIDISSSPEKQQRLQKGITSLQSEMADRRRRGETGQDVTDYLRIHALNQPKRYDHGFGPGRLGPDPSFFKKFHRPYKKISDLPPGVLEMLMKEPGMTENKILGMWWALPEFTRQELWAKHGKPKDWELETWRSKVNVRPGYTEKKSPWELEDLRKKRLERDPPWGGSGPFGNYMFTKPFGDDDMSDMAKAGIFGHEVRHDIYNADPYLWETQPEWVQKVEKQGTPEHKQFGEKYLTGHELYNRFLDERYFPRDTSRPKTINEPYFDKILSDLWAPTASEYELPKKSRSGLPDGMLAGGGRIRYGEGGIVTL